MQKNDMDSSESVGAKSETPNHAFAQKGKRKKKENICFENVLNNL
jgi:hypothetical protein